tara:strand:- start:112 stop:216 length:105 start_codon:yes stop_codon:yes gene_type:complete
MASEDLTRETVVGTRRARNMAKCALKVKRVAEET